MKSIQQTLIISKWAPPLVGGTPTIMRSLLKHFLKGSYSILTGNMLEDNMRADLETTMNCQYYIIDLPPFLNARKNIWYLAPFLECLLIFLVTIKGLYIVKKKNIKNILATTYGGFEVAAYFIHKITGKRLYIYLFDIYEESQRTTWGRFKSRLIEARLLYAAKNVFVMSEFLKEHIKTKYDIESIFIPHALDTSFKYNNNEKIFVPGKKPFIVVYTGMIYEAQIESILNMVKVVNMLPKGKLIFKIYSPQSIYSLERKGIKGHNVFCGFVTSKDIPLVQQEADALFLPYSFNSPFPLVIKTASPAKIAEYLAASRPIIVNAPGDSYISYYARTKGFGIVVDKPNPTELKEAILRLMSDANLRNQLINNARKTAHEHDGEILSKKLQTYLA
ncbi:MAG TPA: glycosyltransferase [Candidatus Brocadiaceae bacterium]